MENYAVKTILTIGCLMMMLFGDCRATRLEDYIQKRADARAWLDEHENEPVLKPEMTFDLKQKVVNVTWHEEVVKGEYDQLYEAHNRMYLMSRAINQACVDEDRSGLLVVGAIIMGFGLLVSEVLHAQAGGACGLAGLAVFSIGYKKSVDSIKKSGAFYSAFLVKDGFKLIENLPATFEPINKFLD